MSNWLKNAVKNLLPLSKEKEDFNIALTEWSFTGETIDYESAEEFCELCEMEGLRYHYQISNALNNKLWVGSKCIERFDILVIDEEGVEVSSTEKEIYLKNKLKDKHIQQVLIALSKHPSESKIKEHRKSELDQYCFAQINRSKVNARLLNFLFLRLDEEHIYYNKRFFGLDIRSTQNKKKLISLNQIQFSRIKASLSQSQIAFYCKNKN